MRKPHSPKAIQPKVEPLGCGGCHFYIKTTSSNPLAYLPTWMQVGAQINPMSYVVDGLRQMVFKNNATLVGGDLLPLWLCVLIVAAFGIFGILLAYVSFKKSIK